MVELSKLSLGELQQLLEAYPWFTAARREAVAREGDDEAALRRAIGRDAVFFLSRDEIFRIASGKVQPAAAEAPRKARPQYYVVGGDYFGKDDFDRLEEEGFAVTTPVFGARAGSVEYAPAQVEDIDAGREMVTETLAQIYAGQELYQRAVDIYEKLILLYPEKSAYFATLIEQVKEKKQK